ncbi:hypothetical protein B0H10DRAFT_2072148, partial [Mycena sp. CBHHK59/15]
PSLDDSLYYALDSEELSFLKTQTGIDDEAELKAHVLDIQQQAYEVYAYPCIRRFGFVRTKISKNRGAYDHVLNLGRTRRRAILLDIGCCFGNDIRKAASDGFPVENIIASDLRQVHSRFVARCIFAGDTFDPEFLSLQSPCTEEPQLAAPALRSMKSLNGLHGHLSAIHSASLFHLFSEAKQLQLARLLAGLLSPLPGSIIFGCHGAQLTKGFLKESSKGGGRMFCHSPESWREIWNGQVFEKGTVQVSTSLRNVGNKILSSSSTSDFYMLFWSVTKL